MLFGDRPFGSHFHVLTLGVGVGVCGVCDAMLNFRKVRGRLKYEEL